MLFFIAIIAIISLYFPPAFGLYAILAIIYIIAGGSARVASARRHNRQVRQHW